jgi:hypothetical protein
MLKVGGIRDHCLRFIKEKLVAVRNRGVLTRLKGLAIHRNAGTSKFLTLPRKREQGSKRKAFLWLSIGQTLKGTLLSGLLLLQE